MAVRIGSQGGTIMDFSRENIPKTKDDWNSLKEQDMELWSDLTQENYDRTLREKRELETKYKDTETQKNNLTIELEKYKTKQPKNGIIVPIIEKLQPYGRDNLPKTTKDWEDLMVKDPVLGTDLRIYANTNKQKIENEFWETRAKTAKVLQEEHTDMYEAELDESNQPKLDDKGKIILKKDKDNNYILDLKTEKGKLFDQLYNQNPKFWDELPNAPELLQSQMERQLRLKGNQEINEVQNQRERMIQDGQVIAEGITPPRTVKITFHSEEEKVHAQRMVNKGLYKTLAEYVVNRDKKDDGIFDEGRMPSFNKK